jgi:deoxyribose-phosphate aldolase
VKASGGVRTLADARAFVAAGATRLGVSGSRALLGDAGDADGPAAGY